MEAYGRIAARYGSNLLIRFVGSLISLYAILSHTIHHTLHTTHHNHHRDRKSREYLIHMCSFSNSQDPHASAECFKSAPNSLEHGMCIVLM